MPRPAATRDLERRSFLQLAALAAGGAWLPSGRTRIEAGELDYAAFLARAVPIARELVAERSRIGEDRYLLALATEAVRLRDVPVPEMRDTTQVGATARKWLGANEGGDPFVVLHWRLDPGAVIEQHAHTYGSVVTLCLEGEVRVRNFEMVGARDFEAKGPFPVRCVVDQVLRPGSINVVALEHTYTHGFVAGPQGARGLDLTTRIRDKQPSPQLTVSAAPIDAARAIYEGSWRA